VEELPDAFARQLSSQGRLLMLRPAAGRTGQAVTGRLSGGAFNFITAFDCATTSLPAFRRQPAFVF